MEWAAFAVGINVVTNIINFGMLSLVIKKKMSKTVKEADEGDVGVDRSETGTLQRRRSG
jgi:hypothetical protein